MGKKKLTAIILAGLMALGFTTLAGQDVATSKAADVVDVTTDEEGTATSVNLNGLSVVIAEGTGDDDSTTYTAIYLDANGDGVADSTTALYNGDLSSAKVCGWSDGDTAFSGDITITVTGGKMDSLYCACGTSGSPVTINGDATINITGGVTRYVAVVNYAVAKDVTCSFTSGQVGFSGNQASTCGDIIGALNSQAENVFYTFAEDAYFSGNRSWSHAYASSGSTVNGSVTAVIGITSSSFPSMSVFLVKDSTVHGDIDITINGYWKPAYNCMLDSSTLYGDLNINFESGTIYGSYNSTLAYCSNAVSGTSYVYGDVNINIAEGCSGTFYGIYKATVVGNIFFNNPSGSSVAGSAVVSSSSVTTYTDGTGTIYNNKGEVTVSRTATLNQSLDVDSVTLEEGASLTIAAGVSLTVSGDFTFDDCDLTLEKGASLTVLGTMSNAGNGTVTIGEGATLTMGSSTTTPSVEALLLGYTYTAAVADDEDTEDVDESADEIIECTGEVTFINNGTVNIYCASLINGNSTNNGTIYTNSKCNSGNKTYAVYKISITGYDETRTAVSTLQYQPTYFAGELTNYGTITAGTWTSLVIDTDNTYNYGTIETTNDKMVTTTPAEMRGLQLGGNFFNYEGASLITRSCAFYQAKVYNWGYLAIIGATLSSTQLSYLIDCENTYGNYFYSFAPMLDTVIYSQLVKRICLNVEYSYNEELVTDSSAIEFSAVGGGYPYVPEIISDYNFVFCNTNSSADGIYYTTYITEGDTLADLGLTISGVYYINSSGEKVYFDYGEKSLYTGVYSATSEGYETKYRYYCEVDTLEPMTAIVEVSCIGDHSYDAGVITTAATCETDGVLTYSCANCDATKEEAIPATGHSYNSGVVTKAATTSSTGVKTYTCSTCGGTKTETIDKLTDSSTSSTSTTTTTTTTTPAVGESITVGKWIYKVTSKNTLELVGTTYKKTDKTFTSFTIKATLTRGSVTYKITSIAANAFKGYKYLKGVTIGANVKTIGKKAFYGCTSLKKVAGCKKVTTIKANAFTKCTKLETVAGCTKVTTIGTSAFNGCKKLTKIGAKSKVITLASVKTIGSKAFYGCTAIKKVNLSGKKLKSIGASAFYKCTAMTTFTCKSTALTKIGASAFYACKKLKTVSFSSTKLKTIGKKAFYGCKSLASVTLKTTKLKKSTVSAKAFSGIKKNCTFKVPKSKISAYKKIFTARGAKSTIKVKKV